MANKNITEVQKRRSLVSKGATPSIPVDTLFVHAAKGLRLVHREDSLRAINSHVMAQAETLNPLFPVVNFLKCVVLFSV